MTQEEENKILSNSRFWALTSKNREYLLKGIPTLIPFYDMPRLAEYIPGVEPGAHVIITGTSGLGKSKITKKLFIKDVIRFSKESGVKVKIFLNSLEENEAKVEQTFVAERLFKAYGVRSDYYTLMNYKKKPLSSDQMSKVKQSAIWVQQNVMTHLDVFTEHNPYAVYKRVREYLRNNGTFYSIQKENGIIVNKTPVKPGEPWNHYEFSEPTMVVVINDTIDALTGYTQSLAGKEKQTLSKYEAIRKFSEYYLRNLLCKTCGCIGVLVSQQKEDFVVFVWLCYNKFVFLINGYNK